MITISITKRTDQACSHAFVLSHSSSGIPQSKIFERLRDEHGYSGGITIVRDYVLARRLRRREVFVPLRHGPGHAQVDFGDAQAGIAGDKCKIHFSAMDLPHSDRALCRSVYGRRPRSVI